MKTSINNQYKLQIINELCPIDLETIDLRQFSSKTISFFKQVDTKKFLFEIDGYAYFRKYAKNAIELVGLESVNINIWDDDGKINIDDDSFNEIQNSLTFKYNL